MSKDEHGLTPLQAIIKETIEEHPAIDDDKEIAKMVFNKRYPDDEYKGKDPSHTYVGKIRRRIAILGKAPEFYVEEQEELRKEYEIEEPEAPEEPEIPFTEDFEPIDPDLEPDIDFDPVDGFTQDDTDFILTFTFDKFADWTGYEGWRFSTDAQGRLTDKNEKRFSGLTHRMMDKYMPDILDLYFMEFMFCYTGIMILGSKGKGYMDYRRKKKTILKDVESTVVETPPESTEVSEIPAPEPATEDEELPPGSRAKGETEFQRRLRRQTP